MLLLLLLLLQDVPVDLCLSEAAKEFNVNLFGALRVTHALLPLLRGDTPSPRHLAAAAAAGDPLIAAAATTSEPAAAAAAAANAGYWDVLIDCLSSFLGVSMCLPSRIVYIGSALAGASPPGQSLYAATKAAAAAAARGLSAELRGTGIRVVSVGEETPNYRATGAPRGPPAAAS